MSNALSQFELAQMRADRESLFMDECQVHRKLDDDTPESVNQWGYAEDNFPETETTPCQYNPQMGRESDAYATETIQADASVILPVSVVVRNIDRVSITKQHGLALPEPINYLVVSLPRMARSGMEVLLQYATE